MGSMKDQLGDLPYEPQALARSSDPETSHAAARQVKVGEWEMKVLRACAAPSRRDIGSTKGEVFDYLRRDQPDLQVDTVGPRFAPLHDAGLLEYRDGLDGKPMRRKWSKGVSQRVHFITEQGLRWATSAM